MPIRTSPCDEALKNASVIEQNDLDKTETQREITEAKLNNRFNASIAASVGFNQTAVGVRPRVRESARQAVAQSSASTCR